MIGAKALLENVHSQVRRMASSYIIPLTNPLECFKPPIVLSSNLLATAIPWAHVHPNFHLGVERIDSGLEIGIDLSLRGAGLVLGIRGCNGNQRIGKAVGIVLQGLEIALNKRAKVISIEVRLLALHGI